MKQLLAIPLLALLLLSGCSAAQEPAPKEWLSIVYENSGSADKACEMLQPKYNLRQRGLAVTGFLQNVSLRDACREYVRSLQDYARDNFVALAGSGYGQGRTFALACFSDGQIYTTIPVWIRASSQKILEVEISPDITDQSLEIPVSALQKAQDALPLKCRNFSF